MNFGQNETMVSERIAVLDLAVGDHFEWCGRRVRLLSRHPHSHKSVVLVVVDTTDADRKHHLFYERKEAVNRA